MEPRWALPSGDANSAAVLYGTGEVIVHDTRTGAVRARFPASEGLYGGVSWGRGRASALLAIVRDKHEIGIVDTTRQAWIGTLRAREAFAPTFSPDGRFLYAIGGRGLVFVDLARLETHDIDLGTVSPSFLYFTKDGRSVVVALYDGSIEVANVGETTIRGRACDTSQWSKVILSAGGRADPRASCDALQVAFVEAGAGTREPDGRAAHNVLDAPVRDVSESDDGRRFEVLLSEAPGRRTQGLELGAAVVGIDRASLRVVSRTPVPSGESVSLLPRGRVFVLEQGARVLERGTGRELLRVPQGDAFVPFPQGPSSTGLLAQLYVRGTDRDPEHIAVVDLLNGGVRAELACHAARWNAEGSALSCAGVRLLTYDARTGEVRSATLACPVCAAPDEDGCKIPCSPAPLLR